MGERAGYVQLRRGLLDHLREGVITVTEYAVFTILLADADPKSGICKTSAGLLSALYGMAPRTSRDALEKLASKGYIKRFPRQGKHGSYPILVNKFICSDGAMKGKRLNALGSLTWEFPIYEECYERVNDDVNEDVNERAAIVPQMENREKRIEKKKPSRAKQASAVDSRFSEFREDFESYFRHCAKAEAPWEAKESTYLSRWLKANPKITRPEWRRILQNRGRSPVAHGEPLSVWIGRSLNWMQGPTDSWGKPIGGTNGNGNGFSYRQQSKDAGNIQAAREAIRAMAGDEPDLFGDGEAGKCIEGNPDALFR